VIDLSIQKKTMEESSNKTEIFFKKIVDFFRIRKQIDEIWTSISSGLIESFPEINEIELPDGTFDPRMRQMSITGQFVTTLPELYEAANKAKPIFEAELAKLFDLTEINRNYLSVAPLKDGKRAAEKANDDYAKRNPPNEFSWLYDIVRGQILCETEQEIMAVLTYLKEKTTERFFLNTADICWFLLIRSTIVTRS